MANRLIYQKPRRLTPAEQYATLRLDFPESTGQLNHNSFVWSYSLSPTYCSDSYVVEIRYSSSDPRPKVYVKEPSPLVLYPGEKELPHVFDMETQLICLNISGEWNSALPISRYYIPWISMWLYYYEVWAITGKWLGSGLHNGVLSEPGEI